MSQVVFVMHKIRKTTTLLIFTGETSTECDDSEGTNSVPSTNSSRCSTPTGPPLDRNITISSPGTSSGSNPAQQSVTSAQIHSILGDFKKPPNMGQSLHNEIQQRWETFLKERTKFLLFKLCTHNQKI